MGKILARGRCVIAAARDRRSVEATDNGAVLVEGGEIIAIGDFGDLAEQHHDARVIGSDRHVVLPGFVNAHHHVGVTPVQLGSLDEPLEMWAVTRMTAREVDPYLDTLYSAFEMLESGVTLVHHIFAWARRDLTATRRRIDAILRAYADVGMRVSFSIAMRDQHRNHLLSDEEMLAGIPGHLRPGLARRFEEFTIPLDEQIALFEDLLGAYSVHPLIRIQLAPGNLHWCSDQALGALQAASSRHGAPMHVHLLETAYQKEYARRRTGGSALEHLQRFGLLGPHLTLGHGVWMNEADIELVGDSGTHVCHNCSSNLRLRSGILPLPRLLRRGINVALGIDEAGLNDDRDMLQEMRLALRLHREPGMDDTVPTAPEILRMATVAGAVTTPFAKDVGRLAPGMQADLVLLDWDALCGPYLDPDISTIDGIVNRAKPQHVSAVMVGGEVVVEEGRIVRIDKGAALEALRQSLAHPLSEAERAHRQAVREMYEPVRTLYSGYVDFDALDPFYASNARH